MRCFIALELDHTSRRSLAELIAGAPRHRAVRWCDPGQLHVTLKFVGDADERTLNLVAGVIESVSAATPTFSLEFGRLRAFPNMRRARVLCCTLLDTSGSCGGWLERAGARFAEFGVPAERRGFSPHVTLA